MQKRTFLKTGLVLAGGGWLTAATPPAHKARKSTPVPAYSTYPTFRDLNRHVFSAVGSRLVLKYADQDARSGLRIKTLRYRAVTNKWDEHWAGDYYDVILRRGGEAVAFELEQSPWSLKLIGKDFSAELIFVGEDEILFETQGCGLSLRPLQGYRWLDPRSPDETVLLTSGARTFHYFLTEPSARLRFDTERAAGTEEAVKRAEVRSITLPEGDHRFVFRETAFEEKNGSPLDRPTMHLRAAAQKRVEEWMQKRPAVPAKHEPMLDTAWFFLQNYLVSPSEFITRPTLLCSKNSWLTKVWAWDHCFHGLALALGDIDLGWDQIKLFFDNQLPNGGLPEPLSDLMRQTGFVKPPVHGWAIGQLMDLQGREAALRHVEELYVPLSRFTDFWFDYYGGRQHGLCYYRHGNDSGWDNATAFDQGLPTFGADLAAYLILQMDVLARMAEWLGKAGEAEEWTARSDRHLQVLLDRCVVDDRFVSPLVATGKAAPCRSLINYMPLLLGDRLPASIVSAMVGDLRDGGDFLTAYGYATEAVNSPKHMLDGYWRGAIWAPPTYHLVQGLSRVGEERLARNVAERYLSMLSEHPIMAENYEATTGVPLQAPGVSWTSAVAVLLGSWLGG